GAYHKRKAPAALGLRDHDWRRPRALAGPVMAEEAIAALAAAAALPLTANVLGAPLPHAREIGDEVVDGLREAWISILASRCIPWTVISVLHGERGHIACGDRVGFRPLSRLWAGLSREMCRGLSGATRPPSAPAFDVWRHGILADTAAVR